MLRSRIASTSASATRTSNAELTEVAPRLIRDFEHAVVSAHATAVQYIDGQPGDRLPGSPEDQATVYFGYDWTLSSRLGSHAQLRRQRDRRRHHDDGPARRRRNARRLQPPSRVGRVQRRPWEFTVYAQNLLDKYAVTGRAVAACVPPDGSRRKRRPRPCAQLRATDGAAARDRLPFQLRFLAGAIRTAW